jgi:phage-related protein
MIVTRRSDFTGCVHSLDLPVTQEQLARFERGDGYVQTIFPGLNNEQREFLLTGVTPDEWAEFVGPEPED